MRDREEKVRGDVRKVELNRKRKAVVADALSCTRIEAVSGLAVDAAVRKKHSWRLAI
jgi:hypothetical protein